MSLRLKLSLAIVAVLGAHFLVSEALRHWVLYPQFAALERDRALDQLRRCCAGLSHELRELSDACLTTPEPARHEPDPCSNEWSRGQARPRCATPDVDIFVNDDGEPLWRRTMDPLSGETLAFDELPTDCWPAEHFLLGRAGAGAVQGVLATGHGTLLVASRRIDAAADASRPGGTRIIARLLSRSITDRMRAVTDGELEIGPASRTDLPPARSARLAAARSARQPLVIEDVDGRLAVSAIVPGLDGSPALWIETSVPRNIARQGSAALLQVSSSNLVLGVAAITLLLAATRELMIRPVQKLTHHVSAIGASGDLGRKLDLNRRDEFGVLARRFDEMLQRLAEYRTRLADSSRQAGMAEVASGVLHNVGNVLNNVNVATDVLHDAVRGSRAAGVSKAAGLLREHESDLAEFIQSDPRGRQIPAYLEELGELLSGEQRSLLDEISKLKISLDHMNQIVQAQRALARPIGAEEPVSPGEVVESAVAMVAVGLQRHGIALERDIGPTPICMLDRQRLMQVLVNLLTNAKDALASQQAGQRRLAVRVRATACESEASGRPAAAAIRARVEIVDNGIGIGPENLTRVFQNGFTTKQNGGGYGLHYCALVAQEMGGELSLSSDGLGRGATAVLELPLKPLPAELRV